MIIVHKEAKGFYSVEFMGRKGEEVRKLFGTSVIPTPYTAEASPLEVLHMIREQNPEYPVYLCDCSHVRASAACERS